jgi:hypothetical protein
VRTNLILSMMFIVCLPDMAGPVLLSHNMEVELRPDQLSISVTDTLSLQSDFALPRMAFSLADSLEVTSIKDLSGACRIKIIRQPGGVELLFTPPLAFPAQLRWCYGGVVAATTLSSASGGNQLFMDKNCQWYPDMENSMARFHAQVGVSEPYEVVSQGRLISRMHQADRMTTEWEGEAPAPSLSLACGAYFISSVSVEEVKLSLFQLQYNKTRAAALLCEASRSLVLYTSLFGPFPYRRFCLVETPSALDFSAPGFTVFNSDAADINRLIVEAWWGNSVYYRPERMNWRDVFATYFGQYLPLEGLTNRSGATAWRRSTSVAHAIRSAYKSPYAKSLTAPMGRSEMLLHQVRRQLGNKRFYTVLREIARDYRGKHAGWSDFSAHFGKSAKRLSKTWMTQPPPQVVLRDVEFKNIGRGWLVTGEIESRPFLPLKVSLLVDAGDRHYTHQLLLRKESTPFRIAAAEIPGRLILDPGWHLFRQLTKENIPPCLHATLASPKLVIIKPDDGSFDELASDMTERLGCFSYNTRSIPAGVVDHKSVIILGEASLRYRVADFFGQITFPAGYALSPGEFTIDGKRYHGGNEALLLSLPHPDRPDCAISIYHTISGKPQQDIGALLDEGWSGIVVFRDGKVRSRSAWPLFSVDSTVQMQVNRKQSK